jgi:hypothetical protein
MSDYSSTYPTQSPTFAFDAKAGKLDSRLSYSRSSGGTYLSNEKSLNSENLIIQSADLGSWSEGSSSYTTVTSNATTSPDGTTTAAQITGLTGTNKKAIYHAISAGTGSYTSVCFVKPDGHEYVQLMFGGATTIYQNYHLNGSGTLGNGTNDAASIDKLGDWYRITLTSNALSSATNYYLLMVDSNTAARYEDSTSTSSIYAWGANFSSTNQKVFNSTSGSIHREFAPTLKTASADEPRFEYAADGQSDAGSPRGLLIESSASNLQRYGSDFASWSNSANISITSNAAVAPNGLLEADLAVAGPLPTTTSKYIYDSSPSIASGTTYTASVYMRDAGQRYVQLLGGGPAFPSSQYATFDLQTGSVDANGITASAENAGNGWWRVQATFVATATNTAGIAITFVDSATSSYLPNFAGNDYDGFLLWGFQLETGSAASSLANSGTSSSGVTRASDSCSVDLSQINYSGGEYTLIADADTLSADNVFASASLYKDNDNYSAMYANGLFGRTVVAVSDGVNSTVNGGSANGRIAASGGTNSLSVCVNGGAVTTDTSYTVPDLAGGTLYLGTRNGSSSPLNGNIKRLSLYSVALSDTELQALSS